MIDFPTNPSTGDQVVGPYGEVYTWDGQAWSITAGGGGGGAFLPLTGGTVTGDLFVNGRESVLPPSGGVISWPADAVSGTFLGYRVSSSGLFLGCYCNDAATNEIASLPGWGIGGVGVGSCTMGPSGTGILLSWAPPVADGATVTLVEVANFSPSGNSLPGNSFLDSVVIPLQENNIGQLSFNAIHAGGVWTYQADGGAGVIQVSPGNNELDFYVTAPGTAGAEVTSWIGVLGLQTTQASFTVPIITPAMTSGDTIVNTILFNYYGANYHWSFNYAAPGGVGVVVSNIDGTEYWLTYAVVNIPTWYPLANWATSGGGAECQANLAEGGGFINWPTNYSSDRRIKSNIQISDFNAEAAVNAIQIWSADWAETGDVNHIQNHHDCCFIADEVEMVIPRAVINNPEPDKPAIINPLHLVSVLWKAVQDLSAKVAALEAK